MEIDRMYYDQLGRVSYKDSLRVLESDVQHANLLAGAIPKAKGGARLEMKLVYNNLAPLVLFFLSWIDFSCACLLPRFLNLFQVIIYKVYADGRPKATSRGRKATIREFYAVIFPSLQQLHCSLVEKKDENLLLNFSKLHKKRLEVGSGHLTRESERDDECGICLETCTKMVTPTCCHAMCIKCYREWNTRSESCPFCRGNLSRVNSGDLWVLTSKEDVVDQETIATEDLQRLYLYINSLPKAVPDALFLMYYEYLM